MTTLNYAQRREMVASEAARQARVAINMRDSQPVIRDLHEIGFPVYSIADLYNQGYSYETAIPVLLKHLPLVTNPNVKESVVRCLSCSWAKPEALQPLLQEWRKIPGCPEDQDLFSLKWAIGNALNTVADDSAFDELLEAALDESNGLTRSELVLTIRKSKRPEALPTLIALLDDPSIAVFAIRALVRRLKEEARLYVVPLLQAESELVRSEAADALKKLDKKKAAAEAKDAGG